jgi:hypothetical protein
MELTCPFWTWPSLAFYMQFSLMIDYCYDLCGSEYSSQWEA